MLRWEYAASSVIKQRNAIKLNDLEKAELSSVGLY